MGGPAVRLRAALPEELFAGGTLQGALGRSVGLSAAEVLQAHKELKRKIQQQEKQQKSTPDVTTGRESGAHTNVVRADGGKHLLLSSPSTAKRRVSVTAGSVAGTRRLSTTTSRRISQHVVGGGGGDKRPESKAAAAGEPERRDSTAQLQPGKPSGGQKRRVSVEGGQPRGQTLMRSFTAPRRMPTAGVAGVPTPTPTKTGLRRDSNPGTLSPSPNGEPQSRGPTRRESAPRITGRDNSRADNGAHALAHTHSPFRRVFAVSGASGVRPHPLVAGGTDVATPPRSALKLDCTTGVGPPRAGTTPLRNAPAAHGASGPPASDRTSGEQSGAYDSKVAAVASASAAATAGAHASGLAGQFARISAGRLQARGQAHRLNKYAPSAEAAFPFGSSVTLQAPKPAQVARPPSFEIVTTTQLLKLPQGGTEAAAAAGVSADDVVVSVEGATSPPVAAAPPWTPRGRSASVAARGSVPALCDVAAEPPRRSSLDDTKRQRHSGAAAVIPASFADNAVTATAVDAATEERRFAAKAQLIRRVSAARPAGLARTSTSERTRRPSVSAAAETPTSVKTSAVTSRIAAAASKAADTATAGRVVGQVLEEERLAVTAFVLALMYVTRVRPSEQARAYAPHSM